MPKLIYLASPYSHKDERIMEARFNVIVRITANLMKNGVHVYSPIAHNHHVAKRGLPTSWDFWEPFDKEMILRCDEIWIAQLLGWDVSKGIAAEIEIAKKANKKIYYLDPETLIAEDSPILLEEK